MEQQTGHDQKNLLVMPPSWYGQVMEPPVDWSERVVRLEMAIYAKGSIGIQLLLLHRYTTLVRLLEEPIDEKNWKKR